MARRYSPKLKFQIVLEVLTGERSLVKVARAYGVHLNSVFPCCAAHGRPAQ